MTYFQCFTGWSDARPLICPPLRAAHQSPSSVSRARERTCVRVVGLSAVRSHRPPRAIGFASSDGRGPSHLLAAAAGRPDREPAARFLEIHCLVTVTTMTKAAGRPVLRRRSSRCAAATVRQARAYGRQPMGPRCGDRDPLAARSASWRAGLGHEAIPPTRQSEPSDLAPPTIPQRLWDCSERSRPHRLTFFSPEKIFNFRRTDQKRFATAWRHYPMPAWLAGGSGDEATGKTALKLTFVSQ
jgi:hypothetical protein